MNIKMVLLLSCIAVPCFAVKQKRKGMSAREQVRRSKRRSRKEKQNEQTKKYKPRNRKAQTSELRSEALAYLMKQNADALPSKTPARRGKN